MAKTITIVMEDEKAIEFYDALYSKNKSRAVEKALHMLYKSKKMRDIYFDPKKIQALEPVKKTTSKVQKNLDTSKNTEQKQKEENKKYSSW